MKWLWPGRIPFGKITVLDGDPGTGKSLITIDLAARASRGLAMPDDTRSDLGGPCGVLFLSAEDDPADTIRPRLDAANADVARVRILTGVRVRNGQRMPTVLDLHAIEVAVAETAAKFVVIDPLMAHLAATDSHRDQDVRGVLAPLAALAARHGVALLVVRHLNKSGRGHPLYRGGGSIGIVGAARSALLVGNAS